MARNMFAGEGGPAKKPAHDWGGGGGSFAPKPAPAPAPAPEPRHDWGGGGGSFAPAPAVHSGASRSTGGGNYSGFYPARDDSPHRTTGSGSNYPAFNNEQRDIAQQRQDKAAQSERNKEFIRNQERMWAAVSVRKQLTEDEWAKLNPTQQRAVEFNGELVAASDDDKLAGNHDRIAKLREALNFTDKQGTVEDFAALMPATTMTDLKPASGSSESPHSAMVATLSKTLDQNAASIPETGASTASGDSLATLLGTRTPNVADSGALSMSDPVISEILQNVATKSNWEAGGTYDQLVGELTKRNYDPQAFMQLVGESLATADKQGGGILGDMQTTEIRDRLGLSK